MKPQFQVTKMGEILQLSSSSPNPKKLFQHRRHVVEQCDRISKLPDEVLSSIISRLTLTEAARTSVLSHRWETLWYSFHGTVDIDAPKKVNMLPTDTIILAMYDYLSSMSQTLPLLSSPLLDAFIVRCTSLSKVCVSHLDLCVQFAMKKKIKRFELDVDPEVSALVGGLLYQFPVEFYAWIKTPCGLDNISSLTSISLNYVNVSEDLIQHLLVNCPLLESLRVVDSRELLNPKFIGGTTLKLKYLELLSSKLESVEICTPNLLTFATNSKEVKLHIKNAPKLVELSILVHVVNERPESVSSYLPCLEKLTLDFSIFNYFYNIQLMHQFDELKKLQHLTWKVGVYHDEDTIKLNSLIEASPSLNKFTLVIFRNHPSTKEMVSQVTSKNRHQCLRVLEIDGFTGADAEIKLVKYILANTASLEQIILDIRGPYLRRRPWDDDASHLEPSKRRALHLKECLPPTVSLLVI